MDPAALPRWPHLPVSLSASLPQSLPVAGFVSFWLNAASHLGTLQSYITASSSAPSSATTWWGSLDFVRLIGHASFSGGALPQQHVARETLCTVGSLVCCLSCRAVVLHTYGGCCRHYDLCHAPSQSWATQGPAAVPTEAKLHTGGGRCMGMP